MLQKTSGIVLRVIKYNDSSNIVDVFTQHKGRVSFIVRIPRSRKATVKSVPLQPLSLIEFEADYHLSGHLHRITEAKVFYSFHTLPYDPRKSAIALFLSEFLYRALREETENQPLFAYLVYSIKWLDESKRDFTNFHLVFLMRLSRFLGLYPNLELYRNGDYFDLQNACFTSIRPTVPYLQPEESSRIAGLMRMNYETMHLFRMNRHERSRCLTVMNDYYRLHLPEFPILNSLEILSQLFD